MLIQQINVFSTQQFKVGGPFLGIVAFPKCLVDVFLFSEAGRWLPPRREWSAYVLTFQQDLARCTDVGDPLNQGGSPRSRDCSSQDQPAVLEHTSVGGHSAIAPFDLCQVIGRIAVTNRTTLVA